MLDRTQAEAFATEWVTAWNNRDLERVLSHYAEDFSFSSPLIARVANEPSGKLRGKAQVGAYWEKALARLPDLRFTLESVLWGVDSLVINYRRENGIAASEWFLLGDDQKVIASAAHHAGPRT
jgi:ketosteroid isomerase-like protein